jgi:hypothetical protein
MGSGIVYLCGCERGGPRGKGPSLSGVASPVGLDSLQPLYLGLLRHSSDCAQPFVTELTPVPWMCGRLPSSRDSRT